MTIKNIKKLTYGPKATVNIGTTSGTEDTSLLSRGGFSLFTSDFAS